MYSSAAAVIALTGVTDADLDVEGSEDLATLIEGWLDGITDWINQNRNRDFELEGELPATVFDSFTETVATDLAAHSPESGQTWTQQTGTIQVQEHDDTTETEDEYAAVTTVLAANEAIATIPGVADGVTKARIWLGQDDLLDDRQAGIIFRYVDVSNYWRLVAQRNVDGSATTIVLTKVVAGTETVKGIVEKPLLEDTWYDIRVATNGTTIRVYYEDKRLFTITSSDGSTNTIAGIYFGSPGGELPSDVFLDDFTHGPLPAVPKGIDLIAERAGANMVALAMLRRNTSIIKISEWEVALVSGEIFTKDIQRDLLEWGRTPVIRIGVVT